MGTGLGHYIPIVFYLMAWIMCLVALFGRPLYTFYFLLPLLPYESFREHLLDFPLGGNMLTFLILSVVIGALLHGKRLPKSGIYTIWLIFGIYLYISMWYGALIGNAPLPLWINDKNFAMWKDYMLLPIVMVAAGLVVEDRKAVRTVIIITAITMLLIDKASIQNSILSRTMTHFDESKRDGGPLGFAGSNGLAAFLAQMAMFFWGFGQYLKTRKYKILCYILVGITIFATMYTFSRAAYITLVLITFLLGILKDRKLIILGAVFLFTWQALVPTAVTERVNMTTSPTGRLDGSSNERVELWTAAQDSILHSPVLGNGYATFQFGQHVDSLRDTHNWYIKVLVETGLVGFLIACALLWKMVALSWNIFRRSVDPLYQGLGLGLVLLIFSNLVLTFFGDRWTYLEINGMLWALLGVATRVYYLKEAEPSTEPATIEPEFVANPYLVMR